MFDFCGLLNILDLVIQINRRVYFKVYVVETFSQMLGIGVTTMRRVITDFPVKLRHGLA